MNTPYYEPTREEYNQFMLDIEDELDRRRQEEEHIMRIGAAFPGKYIKAADLQGANVRVLISKVIMEDLSRDDAEPESKPVVYFQNKKAGMVLNKTNGDAISKIAGTDETDDWTGVEIELFPTTVEAFGKMVDAIRVRPPGGWNAARAGAAPVTSKLVEPSRMSTDEDIPF